MPPAIAAVGAWVAGLTVAAQITLALSIASVAFAAYAATRTYGAVPTQAERKQVLRASASYITWLYGEQDSAGLLVFAEEEAGDQDEGEWLHMVVTHCGHPIESIESLRLGDDDVVTFNSGRTKKVLIPGTNPPQYNYVDDPLVVYKHYPQGRTTVDPYLKSHCPSWKDDMIGRGLAWYRISLKFDQDKFPAGLPNMVARKRGRNDIYDPRDNQTKYTDNPALCMLHFLKNHPSLLYEDGELITQSFIDAANICDAVIPVNDENGDAIGSEPRYTMTAEFNLSEDPEQIFAKMLACCAGEIIRVGGQLGIQVGAYYGPAMDDITDADVVGDLSIQPEVSADEAYNIVRGTYNSKKNGYQETDYPEVKFDTWVTEDGSPKPKNTNLDYCTSATQAQRVAHIQAQRDRFGMVMNIPLNLRGIEFTPGSSFNLALRQAAISGIEFKVLGWEFSLEDCQVVLTCRRESPDYYDDAIGKDIILPPLVNVPVGGIPMPTNPGFTVRPVGDIVQGIVTWQNATGLITATRVIIKNKTTGDVIQTAMVPQPATEMPLKGALIGTYVAEIANIGVNGVVSNVVKMDIVIAAPQTPDSIDTVISNWNAQLIPVYNAGTIPFGTLFEFYKASEADYNAGTIPVTGAKPDEVASSWNNGGLTPNTDYYYFIRAINSYGVSNFTKVHLKTTRETDLVTTLVERLVGIEIFGTYFADKQGDKPNFYIDGDNRHGNGLGTIYGGNIIGTSFKSADFVSNSKGVYFPKVGTAQINSNVSIRGDITHATGTLRTAKIVAQNIVGDITSGGYKTAQPVTNKGIGTHTFFTYTISTARSWTRYVMFPAVELTAYSGRQTGRTRVRARFIAGGNVAYSREVTASASETSSETVSEIRMGNIVTIPANWKGTVYCQLEVITGGTGGIQSVYANNSVPILVLTQGGDIRA